MKNMKKRSILRFAHIGDLVANDRIQLENPQVLLQAINQPATIILNQDKNEAEIGRKSDKLVLDFYLESAISSRLISRVHVSITRLSNGSYILHDHSINGTYVNYYRVIIEGTILNNGDIVCFGHVNGANNKPGQFVTPFSTDLKYKVEIINILEKKGKNNLKKEKKGKNSIKKEKIEKKVKIINKQTKVKGKKSILDYGDNCENSDYPNNVKKRKVEFRSLSISEKKSAIKKSVKVEKSKKSIPKLMRKRKISETMEAELPVNNSKKKVKKKGKKLNKSKISSESSDENEIISESISEMCSASKCLIYNILGVIDWISCDECEKWFHQFCVNFKGTLEEDELYQCPRCSSRNN